MLKLHLLQIDVTTNSIDCTLLAHRPNPNPSPYNNLWNQTIIIHQANFPMPQNRPADIRTFALDLALTASLDFIETILKTDRIEVNITEWPSPHADFA